MEGFLMRSGTRYCGLVLMLIFSSEACLADSASAGRRCAPVTKSQGEVLAVLKQILVAARADDLSGLRVVTTPDFYAYDGGKRLTAAALMELIKSAHMAGTRYEWNVTEPEIHVDCNLAWVTYVNQGFIEDSSGRHESTWLESVVLEYSRRAWRARFLHSTRAPAGR